LSPDRHLEQQTITDNKNYNFQDYVHQEYDIYNKEMMRNVDNQITQGEREEIKKIFNLIDASMI